jgi:hypothetical protein
MVGNFDGGGRSKTRPARRRGAASSEIIEADAGACENGDRLRRMVPVFNDSRTQTANVLPNFSASFYASLPLKNFSFSLFQQFRLTFSI